MAVSFPELAAIRFGYGLSPLMPPPQTVAELMASVAEAGPGPDAVTLDQVAEAQLKLRDLAQARKAGGEPAVKRYRAYAREMVDFPLLDLRRRLARAVDAPAGFGERLVQFWSDHFTIRADGAGNYLLGMAFVDQAIRPNLDGRFEDLLIAADTHPMMLRYLDQNRSFGPNSRPARRNPDRNLGLNENLAREAIELHTLGVNAPYDQTDVRELAELLTGLTYRLRQELSFIPAQAEPGPETVLGQTYGGDGPAKVDDILTALRDLARHPATADHLARKLAVHFISDEPGQDVIEDLAAVWRETSGDLPQVHAALLQHPAAAAQFGAKVRQPFDYMAANLRALGVTGAQIMAMKPGVVRRDLATALARMGQPWNRPTGPDGWPEQASAWITPQGLAARIDWSLQMPMRLVRPLPDPRDFLTTALGQTVGEALAWAVPKAESTPEGIAIVLASNEFNRR